MAHCGPHGNLGEYKPENSIPMLHVEKPEDLMQLTRPEKKLTRYFKCTKFKERCFWTGENYNDYVDHMNSSHTGEEMYCLYCDHPLDANKKFLKSGKELADHVIEKHPFRVFQCNLCMYRACRATHLEIHQATIHTQNYDATVNNVGSFEGNTCKIIVCKQVVHGPIPNEDVFFYNNREGRRNRDTNQYQCLYCTFMSTEKHNVYCHISKTHLDYQMCLYDCVDDADNGDDDEVSSSQHDGVEVQTNGISDRNFAKLEENRLTKAVAVAVDVNRTAQDSSVSSSLSPREDENTVLNEGHGKRNAETSTREQTTQDAPPKQSTQKTPAATLEPKSPLKQNKQNVPLANRPGPKSAKEKRQAVIEQASNVRAPEPSKSPGRTENDIDEDSDDDIVAPRKRRNYIPESANKLFAPIAMSQMDKRTASAQEYKCLLCNIIFKNKIEWHLANHHNGAQHSMKCGYKDCYFIGSKEQIIGHFTANHRQVGECEKVIKFIVPATEEDATTLKVGSSLGRSSILEKSAFASTKRAMPQSKLSQRMKNYTYLGPSRNDKTSHYRTSDPQAIERPCQTKAMKSTAKPSESRTGIHKSDSDVKLLSPEDRGSFSYICFFCDHTVNNCTAGLDHILSHLPIEYICNYCDHRDADLVSLQRHHQTKHNGSKLDVESYDQSDTRNWAINFLNNQIHGTRYAEDDEDEDEVDEDQFFMECRICVKVAKLTEKKPSLFRKFNEFESHFWIHSCRKPKKCGICFKTFPDLPNKLLKHMKTHKNINAFKELSEKLDSSFGLTEEQKRDIDKYFGVAGGDPVIDESIYTEIKENQRKYEQSLNIAHGITKNLEVKLQRISDDHVPRHSDPIIAGTSEGTSKRKYSVDEIPIAKKMKPNAEESMNHLEQFLQDADSPTIVNDDDDICIINETSSTGIIRPQEGRSQMPEKFREALQQDKIYTCGYCSEKFECMRDINKHRKQAHPNQPKLIRTTLKVVVQ